MELCAFLNHDLPKRNILQPVTCHRCPISFVDSGQQFHSHPAKFASTIKVIETNFLRGFSFSVMMMKKK
jgi:hypothetical protein